MCSETSTLGVQIEVEKKYHLTQEDYTIIKEKCVFIEEVTLKDYYLDTNFILAKHSYFLRLRNAQYELKCIHYSPETWATNSEEYDNEDEINTQLEKFNITTDDVIWIMFIETKRKKYSYNFSWYTVNIDVEEYQYGTRYEMEIVYQHTDKNLDRQKKAIELTTIIEWCREELWLTAGSDMTTSKAITCAMHQNIELYEIMTGNIITNPLLTSPKGEG